MPVHDEERTIVVRRSAPGLFAPGTVLGHTYVVETLLARGGMGEVYRAKHIDFGIAKSANPGDATVIGSAFAGKFSYASPEQVGLFGGQVDARSDIYSLGLVLAAAAIGFGKTLEMGASPATVIAARQRLPDLSAVPASLRPVIEPMLQPRPEDRPASMRELLEATAKAEPPRARIRAPAAPRARRNWLRPLLIAAGAIIMIGAAV